MAGSERWYFTKEALLNTPSRKCGFDYDKELSYRQQAANLIQDMGQRLRVTQLCINTAIVYMHRFYMFHSFTKFSRDSIAACALFLAAKVEEQPRKSEHVVKVAHMYLHRESPQLDVNSEAYLKQTEELVVHENIMLQTLGFDIAIEHPHTFVLKCCDLVRATKDLSQTSYFMSTNSLHLTTMCLQYKPTVVACVCIHLACKWSNWEIPRSYEGKDWFYYVDQTVTAEMLEELTAEFLAVLDKCPSRLKRKMTSEITSAPEGTSNSSDYLSRLALNKDEKKISSSKNDTKGKPAVVSATISKPLPETHECSPGSSGIKRKEKEGTSSPNSSKRDKKEITPNLVKSVPLNSSHTSGHATNPHSSMSYSAYKEKREKEKLAISQSTHLPHSHVSHHQSMSNKDVVNNSQKVLKQPTIQKDKQGPNQTKVHQPTLPHQFSREQQINLERQRQLKEREKLRPKNQEHPWGDVSQVTSGANFSQSSSHTPNSIVSQSFSDNLNKSAFGFDSKANIKHSRDNPSSILGNDDFFDVKKEINSKLEFSDDSNQSNLPSLSSLLLPACSSNAQEVPKSPSANCSFMSIFTSDSFEKRENNSLQSSENAKKTNNCKDYSGALSSILEDKPRHPPPILSPLPPDPSSQVVKSKKISSTPPESDKHLSNNSVSKTSTVPTTTSCATPLFVPSLTPSHIPLPSQDKSSSKSLTKVKSEPTLVKSVKSPKSKSSASVVPPPLPTRLPCSPTTFSLSSLPPPLPPTSSTQLPRPGSTPPILPCDSNQAPPPFPTPISVQDPTGKKLSLSSSEGEDANIDHHKRHKSRDRSKHKHHKHKEKHKKQKHKHKKGKDRDKERSCDSVDRNHKDLNLMSFPVPKEKKHHEAECSRKSPIRLTISKKKLNLPDESRGNESIPTSLKIVIPKEKLIDSDSSSSSRKRKSPNNCSDRHKTKAKFDDRDWRYTNSVSYGSNSIEVDGKTKRVKKERDQDHVNDRKK